MRNKKIKTVYVLLLVIGSMMACQKSAQPPVDAPEEATARKATAALAASENGYAVEGDIVFEASIKLVGAEEVPAVETEAKGVAIIRVSNAKKLYTKIILQKEPAPADDIIRIAHIHPGKRGVNAGVLIGLCDKPEDFGKNRSFSLTDAQYDALLNSPLYVNAHSVKFPRGIIRGQLRE
jgi:CHRD domain